MAAIAVAALIFFGAPNYAGAGGPFLGWEHHCGDGHGWANLRTADVTCEMARKRVVKPYLAQGEPDVQINGWSCDRKLHPKVMCDRVHNGRHQYVRFRLA